MKGMEGRTVSSTRTVMGDLMNPIDANLHGNVFGGKLLSMIDLCAYPTAARFASETCVTAAFDRVDFIEPIAVGEFVTLEGIITYVGRTSVEVTISVFAEDPLKRKHRHTNTARVTMVAVRDGKPVPVPRLTCETREDKVRFLQGKARREIRQVYHEEREAAFRQVAEATDQELDQQLLEAGGITVAPNPS
jgi:acyl-CoA hydrolase